MNTGKSEGISAITKHIKEEETDRMYEDQRFIVVHPKTQASSCLYGKGTRWCTAATNDNQFARYHSKGKIYILIDKITHAKYQFHLETSSFVDEKDKSLTRKSPIFQELSVGVKRYFKTLADEMFSRGGENCLRACSFYARWAEFSELEELCRRGMELDTENPLNYILLVGTCYFRRNEVNEQIVWYKQFLHLELPEIYVNLGGCYRELDLDLKAEECYTKGLSVSTDSENTMVCLSGLGSLASAREDYLEALMYYSRAYEASWSSSLRAIIVECFEEIDKAFCGDRSGEIRNTYRPIRPRGLYTYPYERKWVECVRKTELFSNVFFVCGIALYCKWMVTHRGEEVLNEGKERSDNSVQLKFKAYLAKHYYDYERTIAAMDWCCEFLRLDFPEIYLTMGSCCLELGLEREAYECFTKGLRSGSDWQKMRCLRGIGDVLVLQGNYWEAMRNYFEGEWLCPGGGMSEKVAFCAAALEERKGVFSTSDGF